MCANSPISQYSCSPRSSISHSNELVGPVVTVCAGRGRDRHPPFNWEKKQRESERTMKEDSVHMRRDDHESSSSRSVCEKRKIKLFSLCVFFRHHLVIFLRIFIFLLLTEWRDSNWSSLLCCALLLMRWKVPKNEKWRQQTCRCVVIAHDCLIKATIESAERREDFFSAWMTISFNDRFTISTRVCDEMNRSLVEQLEHRARWPWSSVALVFKLFGRVWWLLWCDGLTKISSPPSCSHRNVCVVFLSSFLNVHTFHLRPMA